MIQLHVLASGSRGNVSVVESVESRTAVVIDSGLSKKDTFARAFEAGISLDRVRGLLITHCHSDHVKGLGVVLRGLSRDQIRFPVYAGSRTAQARSVVEAVASVDGTIHAMDAGKPFDVGGLRITPIATSHDAPDSFGFRIEDLSDGDALGYLTDSGSVSEEARRLLGGVNLLALESNHDAKMLDAGPYPYALKQRIASDRGHLSNDQAAQLLGELVHPGMRWAIAMHVSQENNTYRLPRDRFSSVVDEAALPCRVAVAYQERVTSIG